MAETQEQRGDTSWPEYIKTRVVSTITTARVSDRLEFLRHSLLIRLRRKDLPPEALPALLHLIFLTYNRYRDRASRFAILDVLGELDNWNADLFQKAFVPTIVKEAEKIGKRSAATSNCITPAGDRFVLLTWIDLLVSQVLKNTQDAKNSLPLKSLINAQALLLDSLATNERKTIKRSTFSQVRRTIRQNAAAIPDLLDIALSNAQTCNPSYRNAILIGIIIDTSIRYKGKEPNGRALIENDKKKLSEYYIKNILSAKSVAPVAALDAFRDFVHEFVSEDDFKEDYIPVIEKMMLRSPEVAMRALSRIVPVLTFDPAPIFAEKWVDTLFNQLRSTSATVRSAAIDLWDALAATCKEEESLVKISTHVAKQLTSGKVSSWEHRVLTFDALASLAQTAKPAVSEKALEGYLTMIAKESNEQAMTSAIDGFGRHLMVLIYDDAFCGSHQDAVNKIIKASTDGLKSAKAPARKGWAMVFGDTVWTRREPSQTLSSNVTGYLQNLFATFDKIADKPLVWKDGPLEAYILVGALSGRIQQWPQVPQGVLDLLKKHNYPSSLLVSEPKPSFLLWDRIYTKVQSASEGLWFVRALTSLFARESPESLKKTGAGNLVAQALIYILTSHPVHAVRNATFAETAALAKADAIKLSSFVKPALKQWLLDLEHQTKDSTAIISRNAENYKENVAIYRTACVLNAITSYDNDLPLETKEKELLDLMVLAHHKYIASPTDKYNWVTLMQRAGVDPGKVCKDFWKAVEPLQQVFSNKEHSTLFYEAAISAVSTIAFVNPEAFQDFVDFIEKRGLLDPTLMNGIGELERDIWKTPEGELCVDVLNKNKKNVVQNKNRKGFEDEKWEQELRAELAKKKGLSTAQKLTKEEQAAVNAQLKKEAEIRSQVQAVHDKVTMGLDIIRAVMKGNQEFEDNVLAEYIELVLDVGRSKAGLLVGDKYVDTYLTLGSCLDDTIHPIREAIGIATLRTSNILPVPSRWLDEPLPDLVTRILYRLRFVTETQSLSPPSFSYCLPLLEQVITQGGFGSEDESKTEQVIMATDVIGFHCSLGDSLFNLTKTMFASLLHCIKEYPQVRKNAKASLEILASGQEDSNDERDIKVLLQGTLSDESAVRSAALESLLHFDLDNLKTVPELYLAKFDDYEENAALAAECFGDRELDASYTEQMLNYVVADSTYLRTAGSKALGSLLHGEDDAPLETLESIYKLYKKKAGPLDPEYDQFGMVIPETVNRKDPWEARVGLALTLKAASNSLSLKHFPGVFNFLITEEALGDRHEQVRKEMLEAGLALVKEYCSEGQSVDALLTIFESYLNKQAPDNETHDYIRQSVVILYGAAAGYLEEGDAKMQTAIDKLIGTLDTPSEVVQSAVADCLPPLIKKNKDAVPQYIQSLLDKLVNGEKYAHRRGAAYGLAGVVKGRGITALKECNVMGSLKDAVDNKKMYQHRQGALFAFETLSAALGRLFEPYIIQIIPLLLVCFSDSNAEVREAAADAARVIMSKISGHCVKLILPSILAGLEERQWRTKKASVELLGATAYCAPKQLSVSLPTIIPRITEVLADTHSQVQAAANRSLQLFGEVISNPEIQKLVPVLLDALSDPNRKTMTALTALLHTSFVHYIDPPSLALVMPILERGLRERGTDIKTKATQIVGNMASLTDQRDLIPYLPVLLPGVKQVLVDPVPEARGTAAKALGGLVEKLGEENFPDLVDELLDTLKSDMGGVDRQGAAQGLSEVLAGLGLERLDALLPEIIANADSPRSYVREGFISLLIYLPATFGGRFQPYLGRIIPPILMGLADESEFVRDASLRAGRMIVTNYATKAVDLLLPELEKGLFDNNWRIRQSSVQLVGDLLYRITGIASPKSTLQALGNVEEIKEEDAEEEDYSTGEAKKKQLVDILGKERRDRILAALYIIRQDTSGIVRHASLQVWKTLVSNTPRTLKEILPVMMSLIIKNLASNSYEQRTVAARTLGELVRKLGDGILAEILPILEEGMSSPDEDTRQGVTIAFSEIMTTAGKVQILDFADEIIPVIRKALSDSSEEVREAAAQAFDTLHQNVGSRAIDEILPALLNQLQSSDESSTYALSALKEIMAVRANVVFPVLIPTLITVPISAFNARALASLVTVAGSALNRRLTGILSAIVESRIVVEDEDVQKELANTTEALLLSVDEEDGMHTLIATLQEYARSDRPEKRAVACDITATLYSETKLDASAYVADWFGILVSLLGDRTDSVVKSAWNALNALSKSVKKDDYEELVVPVRRAVRSVGVAGTDVPGFCLPKGISPLLPIFLQGLMFGSTANREQSALGVGDLISRTSADALKPFVTQITGPLIRIVGDRYPPQVKAAILQTLSQLLTKVPMHLKPFLPQLQRTFIKSLSDQTSAVVRSRAAGALGILITLQTRVDPLVSELVSGIRTSEPGVKETMMDALQNVVAKAGSEMSDVSKRGVMSVITEGLADGAEPGMMASAARLLGSISKAMALEDAKAIVQEHVVSDTAPAYGALLAINAILVDAPTLLEDLDVVEPILERVLSNMNSEKSGIPEAAITAAGKFLLIEYYQNEDIIKRLVAGLVQVIGNSSTGLGESKRMALVVLRAVGRKNADLLEPYLDKLVPVMMVCVRDRNIPVKLTAERALLYTLQLHAGVTVYEKYMASVDSTTQKQVSDYHRRILTKLVQQEQQRVSMLHGAPDEEAEEEDSEVWQVGSIAKFEEEED